MNYRINHWLEKKELQDIEFSNYWNDEEKETSKEWYILDGNFQKMEDYLDRSNLIKGLENSLYLMNKFNFDINNKIGLNLAAGNLWLESKLFEYYTPKKIYSVEMSEHRLLKIGPKVLEHYKVPSDKIELCLGSFYDIKLSDNSIDFIVLSQALHHASEPLKLLSEVNRVLKDDGFIILMGESEVTDTTRSEEDIMMGDFYYTRDEYESMFNQSDFQFHTYKQTIGSGTLLVKKHALLAKSSLQKIYETYTNIGILGSGAFGNKLAEKLITYNKSFCFVHDTIKEKNIHLIQDKYQELDIIVIAIQDPKIALSKINTIPIKYYLLETNELL